MPSIVNKAASVVFMVTGKEKSQIVKAVLAGPPNQYPAQLIQPAEGELHWFLDENAAAQLEISS